MNKIIALILVTTFWFPITSVTACDKPVLTPAQAYRNADHVFRGRVENLQYLDDPERAYPEPRIIVTFSVTKTWKGEAAKKIRLNTTHNKTTCNGYVFEAGKDYLVYAQLNRRAQNFLARLFSPKQPTLGVKVFAGTKPAADAEEDLKYLEGVSGASGQESK